MISDSIEVVANIFGGWGGHQGAREDFAGKMTKVTHRSMRFSSEVMHNAPPLRTG